MNYFDAFTPGILLAALAAAILPWVNLRNTIVRICALSLSVALAWRYMCWRVEYTIPPVDVPLDFIAGVIFTGVEALAMIGSTASLIFLSRIRCRTEDAERNTPWLLSLNEPPLIDVLICTYNEDAEILERTILGSMSMTYSNYRVWVCDDGRREWLGELCAKHGAGYLTRADNAHAKAGNINAALQRLAEMDQKPQFISILDADFAPMPEFLTRATSLMREDDVGVVQTPQHFYNPDPVQSNLGVEHVWPDEQRFFFDVVMASKDAWGAAFCCGTSSVIRFAALQEIGGFPTDSVTEDYLVSLRLRQRGFRTVYLNEPLSLGLAPEGLAEYTTQRSRWCLGFVQICRGPSGPLKFGNNLPFVDRVMLAETFLYWGATHAFRLLGIIVPALYLMFNIQAVYADILDAISHIFPFIVWQCAVFLWLTEGRVLPVMSDLYQLLCASEVLKSVWAGLTKPKGQIFKVTAKGGDRSRRYVQWPMMKMFAVLLAISVVGVANAFLVDDTRALAESSAMALFWSWYNIAIITLAMILCIEQPQGRWRERTSTDEYTRVTGANGVATLHQAIDISNSGIRLTGELPGPVGAPVWIELGNFAVKATVARIAEDGFALQFEATRLDRVRLTRHIYAGRYRAVARSIKPMLVASAVALRILR